MYYSITKNTPNFRQTFREKMENISLDIKTIKLSIIQNISPQLSNLFYLTLLSHSFIHPQIIYIHTHLNTWHLHDTFYVWLWSKNLFLKQNVCYFNDYSIITYLYFFVYELVANSDISISFQVRIYVTNFPLLIFDQSNYINKIWIHLKDNSNWLNIRI